MERYVYFLAKHIAEQGVDVEVISSPEKEGRKKTENLDGVKYRFISPRVQYGRGFRFYRTYHHFNINLSKYLKKKEFDILHAYEITSFPYILSKNRKPIVVQAFGNEWYKAKGFKNRFFLTPVNYPLKICMNRSEAIASEGELQAREIAELFDVERKKIFNIPDGVDLSQIEEYVSKASVTREDLGLKDDDFIIINVNRIEKVKGVYYLIEALDKIRKEIENVKLILVGTGTDEERVYSLIKKLGLGDIIKHFRNVDDELLFNYYKLADLSVTPTLYEGLPLVILEAMSVELPVIATNTSENPQVVKDGVNGLLVPTADCNAISEAVITVYEKNLLKKMGEESKKIIKDYDWGIIAKKAIKEYEKLV
ncbi:MAG: glycosyltransferase family 4 protein [Candidatus Altiarchaeota archaeon]|nr:glycosyltransferase family 4 protein [Candidatus Altiarchaeota archaeon]